MPMEQELMIYTTQANIALALRLKIMNKLSWWSDGLCNINTFIFQQDKNKIKVRILIAA